MTTAGKPDKRALLMQAAMKLAYGRGFMHTSLADIANEAKVPLGNVYYYFKTKEEIGEAIVEERLAQIKTLHQKLNQIESPDERLCAFIQQTFENRKMLGRSGCPIGTLCTELHKHPGPLAKQSTVLFTELLTWLRAQFEAIDKGADSQELAVHLLSALQGIAVIAHALNDPEVVEMESKRLQEWVRTLSTKTNKRGTA